MPRLCEEEWEEELPYLERGEACIISREVTPIDITCERCGKLLFRATKGSDFVIQIPCKRCHKTVEINYHSR